MSVDLDAIKNKLAKLAKMTTENGCSEAEALNAAARMEEILAEHGLSFSDIQDRVKTGTAKDDLEFGLFGDKKQLHEVQFVAVAIAEYFDCRVFSRTLANGLRVISYFGFKQDIAAALMLTETLRRAMESDYALYIEMAKALQMQSAHGKTLRANFMRGFGSRVSERLREMKRENKAKQATGTALVVLKGQVIAKAMAEADIKLRKGQGRATANSGAYEAGRDAGDRANLSSNKMVGQVKKIGGE